MFRLSTVEIYIESFVFLLHRCDALEKEVSSGKSARASAEAKVKSLEAAIKAKEQGESTAVTKVY